SGTLDLLMNVPKELRDKIISSYNFEDPAASKVELIALYGADPDALRIKIESLGGTFEDLGYGYGIITIAGNKIPELFGIREINYIEIPKNLYLSFEPSNRASCVVEANSIYNIYGEGVLVGFIDSGIDYLNPAFRTENGDTRIDYIYDLAVDGAVYNREKINEAIKSEKPYSIVPHVDGVGHGTHVAGIACAGGNIPKRYYGVAPKSSIAMVKLTRESNQVNAKSAQLMRGIKFLTDKAYELNKPLVINISFSTSDGAHNGESLLEQYISVVANSQRVTIAVAAGNEGGRAHHAGGDLGGTKKIQFNVGAQEKVIIIELYKSFLNDVNLKLTSPNGKSTSELRLVSVINTGVLLNDIYFIYNTGPTPFNINGEIIIVISGVGARFITNGIWTIELTTVTNYRGIFDMWLPIAEGLNPDTRFLNPNVNNTLGIPGTVANVVTVGSYNYANYTISPFSGRGNVALNPVKPDLVAPGENIESTTPNGGFEPLSGTSMSTPAAAGACALLMEFGIIKGRDPYLYGERLKYFLLKGANRNRVDIQYPDNSWGYGTLCVEGALRVWEDEVLSR
ncbi:MAG: S8 family peptidase, partial [Clostridium sp.]